MAAARLLNLRVYQQTNDDQVVGWDPLGDMGAVVQIYARYSETAPEDLVGTTVASARFYRVTGLRLRDQWRHVIYRVVTTGSDGAPAVQDNIRLDGEPTTGPVRGLLLNIRALLRLGGVPVLVYQRVSAKGTRCTCYDPVLKKTTLSTCQDCYNTGWLTGYHPPILTLAQITPEAEQDTPGDTARQEAATTILMAEYPEVRPKDLLYELDTGRRYRVGVLQPGRYGRKLVNQSFSATLLNTNDVEHKLTVPDPDTLEPLMWRVDAPHGGRKVVSSNPGQPVQSSSKLV